MALSAKRFACQACGTAIEGDFTLPVLAQLRPEEQEFLLAFVQCSGSLKDLARIYSVSYPTIRNRMDDLIERLRKLQSAVPTLEVE